MTMLQQGNPNSTVIAETVNLALLYDIRKEYCIKAGLHVDAVSIVSFVDNQSLVFTPGIDIDIDLLEMIMINQSSKLGLTLHLKRDFTRLKQRGNLS